MHFLLFVDETGDFAAYEGTAFLGGALANARNTKALRDQLQATLEAHFPGLPWPLHAAELHAPLAPVGWRLRGHTYRDLSLDDTDLAHPALARIPGWDSISRDWSESAGAASQALLHATLEAGRALARADHRLHARFLAAATRRRARTREAVSSALRATPLPGGPAAACGSWNTPRGGAEGWLAAFEACVGRALALLGPEDLLEVHAARYPHVSHLALREAAGRARAQVASGAALHVHPPAPWGAATHPGVVLADLLLGRLHHEVRDAAARGLPWGRLAGSASVPVEWPARSRPTLTATNEAPEARWVLDQRELWERP
jgi:hypothetical protein